MKNFNIHYLFISFLSVGVMMMIYGGFNLAGSPWTTRLVELDSQRLRDFEGIKSRINIYYSNNYSLPANLALADLGSYNQTDPKTTQNYEYKVLNQYEYELCTNFDTEFKDTNNGSINFIDRSHSKGPGCIKYIIDDYYRATPAPSPIIVADPNYGMRAVIGTFSSIVQNNNGTYTLKLTDVTFFDTQSYTKGLIVNDLTQISYYTSTEEAKITDLTAGDKVSVTYTESNLIVDTILITSK